jgi:hypothetical protein
MMADSMPKRRSTDRRGNWRRILKVVAIAIPVLSLVMTAYQWHRADSVVIAEAKHEAIYMRIDAEAQKSETADSAMEAAITAQAKAVKELSEKVDAVKADTGELKTQMKLILRDIRLQFSMDGRDRDGQ